MRRLAIAATIAALTFLAGQAAQAATWLRYDFNTLSSFDNQFSGSFTGFIEMPGPVGAVVINGVSLPHCVTTLGPDTVDCSMAKLFTDYDATGLAAIELWFSDVSNQYTYLFAPGALTAPGLHNSIILDDQQATLRVSVVDSLAVPEPATWAMMILGVGMAGAAVRAQRRRPARAKA